MANAQTISSIERSQQKGSRSIRPEIAQLLAQLKRRIRVHVLAQGAALVAAVVGGLFWLSFAVDWAYFSMTGLELPVWFREACAVLAVTLLAAAILFWIVLRIFGRFRARALALVLERRFPQLGSRLITAVEMAESRDAKESQLTAAMVDRTVEEAVRMSSALPIESVFDRTSLRRSAGVGTTLLFSVAVFALVDPAGVHRWVNAFVLREPIYWLRETELVVKAVIQPGDRIREFKGGELKHPRGVDLVLLVEVPEGKKTPRAVELRYVLDAGRGSSRIDMLKTPEGQFRHTITGLIDSASLWLSGGDFITRTPLRVEVVEPPRLDQVALDCDYPTYTGLAPKNPDGTKGRRTVEIQSSQVALPMETAFQFHAQANKPLVALHIETESKRINIGRDKATIAKRLESEDWGPEQPLTAPASQPFLSADGLHASLPFLLTSKADPKKPEASPGKTTPNAPKGTGAGATPAASQKEVKLASLPILLPTDSRMRIELEDVDGVASVEPIHFVINGIVDQPPVIQTELRGIGTSITRKAVIPVAGTITDDYGVAKSRFEFRVGDAKDWRVRAFRRPPDGTPKEFALRRDDSEGVERFEVLPLELPIGQRLTLTVFAEDGDNLNGPHGRHGEEYTFQIVSNEELLSLLYVKEVNLRERFEKIISELEKVQKDLSDHRRRAIEKAQLESASTSRETGSTDGKNGSQAPADKISELQTAINVCAVRSLHQLRKNSVETASIEESFRGLLEELVNNAVHTQQMVNRIGTLIVQPLHTANEKDFPAADEAIGLFKLAVDGNQDPVPKIENSIRSVGVLIARLRSALNEMEELVKFHEAISRLQGMIKEQEQVLDSTKQDQKKKRLKELKGLDLK